MCRRPSSLERFRMGTSGSRTAEAQHEDSSSLRQPAISAPKFSPPSFLPHPQQTPISLPKSRSTSEATAYTRITDGGDNPHIKLGSPHNNAVPKSAHSLPKPFPRIASTLTLCRLMSPNPISNAHAAQASSSPAPGVIFSLNRENVLSTAAGRSRP